MIRALITSFRCWTTNSSLCPTAKCLPKADLYGDEKEVIRRLNLASVENSRRTRSVGPRSWAQAIFKLRTFHALFRSKQGLPMFRPVAGAVCLMVVLMTGHALFGLRFILDSEAIKSVLVSTAYRNRNEMTPCRPWLQLRIPWNLRALPNRPGVFAHRFRTLLLHRRSLLLFSSPMLPIASG